MSISARRFWVIAALLAITAACAGGTDSAARTRTTPGSTAAKADGSSRLFGPKIVHEVAFDIAPNDLQALSTFGDERVRSRLTVDGTTLTDAGVRLKQGFGSMRGLDAKAAFSIKTDEFVPDQNVSGIARFTLNNSVTDPSFVAEQLSYDVFRAAGIPAPRTALANVRVNGELFGLYVLREGYDKRFLKRNFSDENGNLYETTTVDISDPRMELRTNETRNDTSDIQQLAAVVNNAPDAEFLQAAGKLVDLHEFFTYWAVETLITDWDAYLTNLAAIGRPENPQPNNFYAYRDPDRAKFVILPHGADMAFGIGRPANNGLPIEPTELGAAVPTLLPPKAAATFAVRLWALPGTRDRLRTRILAVLDHAWNESALLERADTIAALVRGNGLMATREESTLAGFEQAFAHRRAFIVERATAVRAELAAALPG